jgi:hypothetical protein
LRAGRTTEDFWACGLAADFWREFGCWWKVFGNVYTITQFTHLRERSGKGNLHVHITSHERRHVIKKSLLSFPSIVFSIRSAALLLLRERSGKGNLHVHITSHERRHVIKKSLLSFPSIVFSIRSAALLLLRERSGKGNLHVHITSHERRHVIKKSLLSFPSIVFSIRSAALLLLKVRYLKSHNNPSTHHLPPHSPPQHHYPQTPIHPPSPHLLHQQPYPSPWATSSPNTPPVPSSSLP